MAFEQYLVIEKTKLPLPDSYELSFRDIEADTTGETEAGTIQRDVVRSGVAPIQVTFSVSATWVKKLSEFSKEKKLNVSYFDTSELKLHEAQMYLTNFKTALAKDTSKKGLWTVSFTLNEF